MRSGRGRCNGSFRGGVTDSGRRRRGGGPLTKDELVQVWDKEGRREWWPYEEDAFEATLEKLVVELESDVESWCGSSDGVDEAEVGSL